MAEDLAPAVAAAGGAANALRLVRWTESVPGAARRPARQYGALMRALFAALACRVPDSRWFVDSSKTSWRSAGRPLALARSGLEVRVIHLQRDAAAVVAAARRGRNDPAGTTMAPPPHLSGLRAVAGWSAANAAARRSRARLGGTGLMYADLCRDPAKVLRDLAEALALPVPGPWEEPVERVGHRCAGNRLRFEPALRVSGDAGAAVLPAPIAWLTRAAAALVPPP